MSGRLYKDSFKGGGIGHGHRNLEVILGGWMFKSLEYTVVEITCNRYEGLKL